MVDMPSRSLDPNCLEICAHPARFFERCVPVCILAHLFLRRQLGAILDIVNDLRRVLVFLTHDAILSMMHLATVRFGIAFSRKLTTPGDFVFQKGETLQREAVRVRGGGLIVVCGCLFSPSIRGCSVFPLIPWTGHDDRR